MSILNKDAILSNFPNVKHSYENITHKKVYNSNYIVAIPSGKKCFVWFTTLNGKPVSLLLELDNNKKVQQVKLAYTKFLHDLVNGEHGTILYGTKFYYSNMNFFSIEDILMYKGIENYKTNWQEKLEQAKDLMENNILQKNYNNYLVFGLPLMCKTMDEFEVEVQKVGYRIDSVQFKLYNRYNSYLVMDYRKFNYKPRENSDINLMAQFGLIQSKPNEPVVKNVVKKTAATESKQKRESTFIVRADIQSDIYNLFNLDKEDFIGVAHIPDYNTSVMMNNLFRIIKENKNLDALEESDDEEEFENENDDKFVHLDKEYKMVCEYNPKFKKWIPLRVVNLSSKN